MTSRTRLNWKLPLLLFLATCLTTTFFRIDFTNFDQNVLSSFLKSLCLSVFGSDSAAQYWQTFFDQLWKAIQFSAALVFILTCHELGHYLQSRRYRLRSSLPFFIPMPFGPLGTLGAVIAMDDEVPHSRALFDIGITGPLAGLIPTLIFLYYGISWSYLGPRLPGAMEYGNPLLFQWMIFWTFGPIPPDITLHYHPVAFAAWAGLFLTSLNLMPFSQLDGGHIFYAMLGRRSIPLAHSIFVGVIIAIAWFQLWNWSLILILIALMGIAHPPTANDAVPLKLWRHCLGWTTLLFVIMGFTPTPLTLDEQMTGKKPVIYCLDCELAIPAGLQEFS